MKEPDFIAVLDWAIQMERNRARELNNFRERERQLRVQLTDVDNQRLKQNVILASVHRMQANLRLRGIVLMNGDVEWQPGQDIVDVRARMDVDGETAN